MILFFLLPLFVLYMELTVEAFVHNRPSHCSRTYCPSHHISSTADDTYQGEPIRYLATCIPGLASVLAQELRDLGGDNIQPSGNAAVIFEGNEELGLKALLYSRTAHRLLELLAVSNELIQSRDDIHSFCRDYLHVKELLGDGKGGLLTLSVSVVLNQKNRIPADINHSHYTALTIKNALCDMVRDLRGDRPSVDTEFADVPLVAILRGAEAGAEISIYRSLHPSGSLHRRGYRGGGAIHKAAMKESMAAGLLLHAGWDKACKESRQTGSPLVLVDPMVGSGSLVLEAAMMAADIAPGLMRIKCGVPGHQIPPALRWKSGQPFMSSWKQMLQEATHQAKQGLLWVRSSDQIRIIGNDIHKGALDICEQSLQQAGFSGVVDLRHGDCAELHVEDKCIVATNPPWGLRLTNDMTESWESLRLFLRFCVPGTQAWVLSGNKDATKHLGLRRSESIVLQTGQQDLRWIRYDIRDKESVQETDSIEEDRDEEKHDPRRSAAGKGYPARQTSVPAKKPVRVRKGEAIPLTERERKERRNSWYI